LATSVVVVPRSEGVANERGKWERGLAAGLVTVLTFVAVAVHGYHPYAEDGGVYLPEIKRLLRPELYPHGSEFVAGHLRVSMFAPLIAAVVRWTHVQLDMVLLVAHLASFWMTLFAVWLLAARCYGSWRARLGAVGLMAVWMNLPVAGTSLMLMDPYLTARSFSTPLILLALVGGLDFLQMRNASRERSSSSEQGSLERAGFEQGEAERGKVERRHAKRRRGVVGLLLCGGAIVSAAAMHPLMAAYGFGAVLMLACVMSSSKRMRVMGTLGLCGTAIGVAAAVQLAGAPESEAYRMVELTRSYWFLSQWQWYELLGLVAPLLILATIAARRQGTDRVAAARVGMARMAVGMGVTGTIVAMLFARTGLATHLVARLQPLRVFQLVYIVMIVVIGAALGDSWRRRSSILGTAIRWAVTFGVLAGIMFFVDRQTFPASDHLELPRALRDRDPKNEWEQAFAWIRRNTPEDALFAMDPHYITAPGEDAQEFRAIAERSALPDYSKDGGVVSIDPALTTVWMAGQIAQRDLNTESDRERIAALRPLAVSWIVLDERASTELRCDYANVAVKVCRLF